MNGKVWLVGAGPSDISLLTLKGQEVISNAEVVIYDQLVDRSILLLIPEEAEVIDAGKHAGNHTLTQEETNELLVAKAKEGKRVVRLKGGDPFVFGRGGEEIECLIKNDIAFEVVPGITSSISVPAYAGIPVTHRDYTPSFHVVTAHRKRGSQEGIDYKALAGLGNVTLIFLMGVAALPDICSGLIDAGVEPSRACAIIQNGSRYNQRVVTGMLCNLPEKARQENIGTPGIIIVGDVVTLQQQFAWAEKRILGQTRVIVTRPKEKGAKLSKMLRELGAEVLEYPMTKVLPIKDGQRSLQIKDGQRILQIKDGQRNIQFKEHVAEYDWIVFTSEYAVEQFFEMLKEEKIDIRSLYRAKFAVIGEQTGRCLQQYGIIPDLMPDRHYGKELGSLLAGKLEKDSRVLVNIPANAESTCYEQLLKEAKQIGFTLDACYIYQTELNCPRFFTWAPEDIVTFASSLAVEGFVLNLADRDTSQVKAVCIGMQTYEKAKEYGMQAVCAKDTTMESMAESVIELAVKKRQA